MSDLIKLSRGGNLCSALEREIRNVLLIHPRSVQNVPLTKTRRFLFYERPFVKTGFCDNSAVTVGLVYRFVDDSAVQIVPFNSFYSHNSRCVPSTAINEHHHVKSRGLRNKNRLFSEAEPVMNVSKSYVTVARTYKNIN